MINKKGNAALIVIACVLTVIVIILLVIAVVVLSDSGKVKNNKVSEQTEKKENNISKEDNETLEEDKEIEEVKKIDDAQGNIYEKEVSVDGKYNVKVPVINLTTKAATRINNEVETKYKEASSKGYYIVYSYYMYTGMVTLILDNTYNSGVHTYEVYNINLETGKQMKNEDLLEKLKVSKDDFISKAKDAYKFKFEEVFKDLDKDSNEYKSALNNTLNNALNVLNNPMYINLEGKFAVYANITSVAGASEVYYLVEF